MKKAKKANEPKKAEKRKREEESAAANPAPALHVQPKQLPPNNVLFVENLPEQANDLMLQMLFQQ